MQMFSGCTMWTSRLKSAFFDVGNSAEWHSENKEDQVDYSKKAEEFMSWIDSLLNNVDTDDISKENMQNLVGSLDKNVNDLSAEVKKNLLNSINRLLNDNNAKNNLDANQIKSLKALCVLLGWTGENPDEEKNPNPSIDLNLVWINDSGKSVAFSSGLVKETPKDWEKEPAEELQLYKVIDEINNAENGYKARIKILLEKDNLKGDENLKNTGVLLDEISKVIDHNDSKNVNTLQKYIYDNIYKKLDNDNEDKKEFESKNHMDNNGNFDWKFGKSTLKWLKAVLSEVSSYISEMEEAVKSTNNESSDDPNKAGADSKKNNNEFPDDPNKAGADSGKDKNETSLDEKPLEFGGNKYPIMENNSDIASKAGLQWAIFYSTYLFKKDWPQLSKETSLSNNWEKEYYLKLSNKPKILYKVQVDDQWNLCPLAIENNSRLVDKNKNSAEMKILFGNNDSCKAYLHNKLPDIVKSECRIWWNNKKQDYTLTSHLGTLTIEPMTIAWNWISEDLWKNLAFLNLTNYIRYTGKEFDKKDPDVNKKLKVKWIKIDGKRVSINKWAFWLSDASPQELARFKKYNNGEDWRDNRDKKRENKIYKKIL